LKIILSAFLLDAYRVFWGGSEIQPLFLGTKEAMETFISSGKIVGTRGFVS
jgi:hypothetical protein